MTTMPNEIVTALLVTIIAVLFDLERRVARLETLINNLLNRNKGEEKCRP